MEALRRFSAKFIAEKANASTRTAEGWKQGRSAPQGRHVIAMMSDDQLCAELLKMAGKGDAIRLQETISALKSALDAVEGR